MRSRLYSLAAVVVAAVLLGMVVAGVLDLGFPSRPQRTEDASAALATPPDWRAPDFATLAERVVGAVVSVSSVAVAETSGRRLPRSPFRFFFGEPERSPEPRLRLSSGSAFFISPSGELLTNAHVVEGVDRVEVALTDGSRFEADVVGRDPETDLALLAVVKPGRSFPALHLARSGVRVGEWVMAVGNPLNMDHTVTVGVVSAVGRVLGLAEDHSFESFIQTDAAVNRGSSGGPLVNLRGEVVGVNTAVSSRGQNLSFAVPADTVVRVLPQLRETGAVVRGALGVMVRDVDPRRQEAFALPDRRGAFVEEVAPGRPGAVAGLRPGDVILSVEGLQVSSSRELVDEVSARRPGSEVTLEVLRDGARLTVVVELERREPAAIRPADPPRED